MECPARQHQRCLWRATGHGRRARPPRQPAIGFVVRLHRNVSSHHCRRCPRSWAVGDERYREPNGDLSGIGETELSVCRRSCSTCRPHDASSLGWDGGLESCFGALPRGIRCSYHASQHSRCMTKPRSPTNQTPKFSCESTRLQMKHVSLSFIRPSEVMHVAGNTRSIHGASGVVTNRVEENILPSRGRRRHVLTFRLWL